MDFSKSKRDREEVLKRARYTYIHIGVSVVAAGDCGKCHKLCNRVNLIASKHSEYRRHQKRHSLWISCTFSSSSELWRSPRCSLRRRTLGTADCYLCFQFQTPPSTGFSCEHFMCAHTKHTIDDSLIGRQ
ncbi:hypothetical protein DMENIID0001_012720 [Sergentomyia squamirostris]